jgi:hypothetical protein
VAPSELLRAATALLGLATQQLGNPFASIAQLVNFQTPRICANHVQRVPFRARKPTRFVLHALLALTKRRLDSPHAIYVPWEHIRVQLVPQRQMFVVLVPQEHIRLQLVPLPPLLAKTAHKAR